MELWACRRFVLLNHEDTLAVGSLAATSRAQTRPLGARAGHRVHADQGAGAYGELRGRSTAGGMGRFV